jgi:hypothetical protein
MFSPTIVIGNSTNYKKLLESHTTTQYGPCLIATQSLYVWYQALATLSHHRHPHRRHDRAGEGRANR